MQHKLCMLSRSMDDKCSVHFGWPCRTWINQCCWLKAECDGWSVPSLDLAWSTHWCGRTLYHQCQCYRVPATLSSASVTMFQTHCLQPVSPYLPHCRHSLQPASPCLHSLSQCHPIFHTAITLFSQRHPTFHPAFILIASVTLSSSLPSFS